MCTFVHQGSSRHQATLRTPAYLLLQYIFMLLQGDELVKPGAVRALRCQLRRANPFYADTPAPASQLAPKQLQVRASACFSAL
jgi:hypothetical protein